ncbi:SUF system NifU family Fe-S cluster assembly protein [Pelagicoccus sp. NFK12]|uniref:SUF system NifU family Fe-S cluster assembly protein n=1 Tax=Pelagicoccus enzymogenes TaxID=2773457 RepID=A0A927FB47_9BACT|nr:SUF system NifU family Fe-S cluster assembly protein [Pelagicoccus enzymogenes]MBD5781732.1 SUF system NifU family Fe-S cluster assembly protein [Pelagicoccus enzymogenes]MDQ8199988.1 SUF system NifU family Fe-S cluster assembly protein [Pelagicoccus enzymogenes]
MNSDLKKLYQQTLLQHSKQPHNNGELPDAASATVRNPLCGDEITVYHKTNDGEKSQIAFTAQACTICLASASMMTQHLATLPTPEAVSFSQVFVSKFQSKPDSIELPGELAALSGVLSFPSRIRCATLPFEAYLAAFKSGGTSESVASLDATSPATQEPK